MSPGIGAGIAFLIFGLGILIAQDVVMKQLTGRFSILQLLFLRSVFSLALFQLVLWLGGIKQPWVSAKPGLQILRGFILFTTFACYYAALSVLPLFDVAAIFFIAPLVATCLSALILGEAVGWHRWVALLAGFAGALLMIQPVGTDPWQPASLFALAAAMLYAGSVVATRFLGHTDQASTTCWYTIWCYLVLAAPGTFVVHSLAATGQDPMGFALVRLWVPPDSGDCLILAGAGAAALIGFFCIANAYRAAPVPVLSPFEYTALLWAGVIGYLVFGDYPTSAALTGAGLIALSGIGIALGERPAPVSP